MKELRGDLRKGMALAAKDPELKGLKEHADLVWGMVYEQVLAMEKITEPPWGDAVEAFNDWNLAKAEAKKIETMSRLEEIIRSGATANKRRGTIRREVREMLQEYKDLYQAEWKRLTDLKSLFTPAHMRVHMDAVERAAERAMPDPKQRTKFLEELVRLLEGPKEVKALGG